MLNTAQKQAPSEARQIFNNIAELSAVKTIWLKYSIINESTDLPFPIQSSREGFVSIKDGIAFTDSRALAAEILILGTRDSLLKHLPDQTRTLLGSIQACVLLEEGILEAHQNHFLKVKQNVEQAEDAQKPYVIENYNMPPNEDIFGGIVIPLENESLGSRIQVGWHGRDEDIHTDAFAEERHIVTTVCESTGQHCGSIIYTGDKTALVTEQEIKRFKFDSAEAGNNLAEGVKYFIAPNRVPVFFRGAFGQDSTFHSGSKMPENGLRTLYSARSLDTGHIEFNNLYVESAITPPQIFDKLRLAVFPQQTPPLKSGPA